MSALDGVTEFKNHFNNNFSLEFFKQVDVKKVFRGIAKLNNGLIDIDEVEVLHEFGVNSLEILLRVMALFVFFF